MEMVEDVIEIIFSLQKGAHSLNFQEKKRK
jgi:hypothetical protein